MKMGSPVVQVNEGKLSGCTLETIYGEKILAYLGIPYAKPPVGNLRFKAPEPIEPWTGIKTCTIDEHPCVQIDPISGKIFGSDDCLYLNIYTKSAEPHFPKPVLVFIHGGAFISGSNGIQLLGPDYLITEDIVLVTINYRLGMMGFLVLDDLDLEVPGNAGLKDQALALKWIKKNIENFGGDSNNITVFGESAGSVSAHYHVLSPVTKGLFHKAIASSGVTLNTWAHRKTNVLDIVRVAGLDAQDEEEALAYLLKLPVEEICALQDKFIEAVEHNGIVFCPVIEKPNPTAFITELPHDLITSGRYNHVPLMLGYCDREGLLWVLLDAMARLRGKDIPKRPLAQELAIILQMSKDSGLIKDLSEKVQKLYLDGGDAEGKILVDTDVNFLAGIIESAELHAKTSPAPVYVYQFSLDTRMNFLKIIGRLNNHGACHADDLGYLFKCTPVPPPEKGSDEDTHVKKFVKLITNFSKTSNPTPTDCDLGVTWKSVEKDALHYLNIGEQLSCGVNPEPERMQLWKEFMRSYRPLKIYHKL